jgi:hypothetical protein
MSTRHIVESPGPCPTILPNQETWLPTEEEDEGYDRNLYRCTSCPQDHCSSTALKNAKLWSFISPEMVRCYMAHHLSMSSLHNLDDSQAMLSAAYAEITVETQTKEDRDSEREDLAKWGRGKGKSRAAASSRDRSRSPPRFAPPEPRSPPRRLSRSQAAVRQDAIGAHPKGGAVAAAKSEAMMDRMTQAVETLSANVMTLQSRPQGHGVASSSQQLMIAAGGSTIALTEPTVTLPVSHLRLVLNSVKALRSSAENLAALVPVLHAAEQALNNHL